MQRVTRMAKMKADNLFLARLCAKLKKLRPETRREIITRRLTQEQRLALERWMLQCQASAADAIVGRSSRKRPKRSKKKPAGPPGSSGCREKQTPGAPGASCRAAGAELPVPEASALALALALSAPSSLPLSVSPGSRVLGGCATGSHVTEVVGSCGGSSASAPLPRDSFAVSGAPAADLTRSGDAIRERAQNAQREPCLAPSGLASASSDDLGLCEEGSESRNGRSKTAPRSEQWSVVHMGQGFYAQAQCGPGAEAIASLAASSGVISASGALGTCRGGGTCDSADRVRQLDAFEASVQAAMAKALLCSPPASLGPLRLLFRTRVTFSRSVRLSTPLQGDLGAALGDWRTLAMTRLAAEHEATCHRSALQSDEESAKRQWRQTSAAWAAIWSAKGAVGAKLERQLALKEAACASLWARMALKRSNSLSSEAKTRHQIERLLSCSQSKRRRRFPGDGTSAEASSTGVASMRAKLAVRATGPSSSRPRSSPTAPEAPVTAEVRALVTSATPAPRLPGLVQERWSMTDRRGSLGAALGLARVFLGDSGYAAGEAS
ncbi:unnamed protein product [Polarella glacialis]|uniref:Uncharacterized protein n=1 Tax=Polarella glacialis TaxID=89957 RepID=A0A813FKH2_POLGL|nr:unnamed protein product [Polarella glacialis]